MNNWTDQKATQKLTKKQIKKITDKAYSDMIGLILVEKLPPREAIAAAIAAWEPAYYEVLSKAFSDTLQKSVGVDEIKAYRVGRVRLSYSSVARLSLGAIKCQFKNMKKTRPIAVQI